MLGPGPSNAAPQTNDEPSSRCRSAHLRKWGNLGRRKICSKLVWARGSSTVFGPVCRSPMFWGAWSHPKHWPDRDGLVCDFNPPAISLNDLTG
ncbi:hypothetical protein CGCSCA4_v007468 [Colletotrichum siamense]|uniref:Uncharacterized protein n=1 Tax=Colletotrichum siamense TaxID=690259 RepID=A0A9P5BKQ7_COLSI|nr:hypothetical protein CGCSCA2_v014663 [Colletotrichum siamense]KAF4844585.1 hypothetical protein CGCSCA4_v007468 [Colletotrichum siamense]